MYSSKTKTNSKILRDCRPLRCAVTNDQMKVGQMFNIVMSLMIWYHLFNLKKREKHPRRNVTFSKVAG